ncbi:uncharacterized protein LOC108023853 isoform X2 [Drosophila biarmipes]|uniref:uncharacterized protein LOC108023853 isoform X2 n=1 Tax=Drosophila biarmipes TaxID=125945 RepID=UPI001CDACDE6|nr:uncharacterized protein LOC108023853 isoform X2 [Drosophila biarmipes]
MLKLNLVVILGFCWFFNTFPVEKSLAFAFPGNKRNRTLVETTDELDKKLAVDSDGVFGLFGKPMPMVATKLPEEVDTAKAVFTGPQPKWNRMTTSLVDSHIQEGDLYNLAKKLAVKSKPKSGLGHRLLGNHRSILTPRVRDGVGTTQKDFPRPPANRRFPNFWKNAREKEGTGSGESEDKIEDAPDQRARKQPGFRGKGVHKKTGDGQFEGYEVKEMTLQVPNMQTDRLGNWVYNQWGATYGHQFMDTRFAKGKDEKHQAVRYRVDQEPLHKYDPNPDVLSTVCLGRSTIYNYPKVFWWLNRMIHNVSFDHRTIWMELRRELYVYGRSEECHTTNFTDFRDFQECTLRRNQRMEYMIPQYPLQQVGYRKYYHKKQAAGGAAEDEDDFEDDF